MPDERVHRQHSSAGGAAGSEGAGAYDWQALHEELGAGHAHGADGLQCLELCPICRAADVLRAGGPPELRGQLSDFQREALLTVRALVDHYIERLDERPEPGGHVEDIPID